MKNSKYPLFHLLPFIIFGLVLLTSWQLSQSEPVNRSSPTSNNALPNINLPLLLQPSHHFTSKMLEGNVSLLIVWASWCPACQAEHPALMKIKTHSSVPIYGINFKDDPDNAIRWLKSEGNPYVAIGVDVDGTVAESLNIEGIPETILLDKHGIIRYRFKGVLTMHAWENILQPLIKQLTREQ